MKPVFYKVLKEAQTVAMQEMTQNKYYLRIMD